MVDNTISIGSVESKKISIDELNAARYDRLVASWDKRLDVLDDQAMRTLDNRPNRVVSGGVSAKSRDAIAKFSATYTQRLAAIYYHLIMQTPDVHEVLVDLLLEVGDGKRPMVDATEFAQNFMAVKWTVSSTCGGDIIETSSLLYQELRPFQGDELNPFYNETFMVRNEMSDRFPLLRLESTPLGRNHDAPVDVPTLFFVVDMALAEFRVRNTTSRAARREQVVEWAKDELDAPLPRYLMCVFCRKAIARCVRKSTRWTRYANHHTVPCALRYYAQAGMNP